MFSLKAALLAATMGVAAAAASGIAYAQMDQTYDLNQLPAISGKVVQYLPTPRGEIDGLLLDNGTEVHFPPHLSSQVIFAVRPGDTVTVHGLKARALPLVAAASITNDATHTTVTVGGPPSLREERPIEAQGTVKAQLFGPRGDLNGVLLQDGTVIHLPPPEAQRLADTLAVGKPILARGPGYDGPLGRALDAEEIGPDAAHLAKVAGPRPWGEQEFTRHWRERMWHGPMHGERAERGDAIGAPPPPPPQPAQ
jgi:hypothetical protein